MSWKLWVCVCCAGLYLGATVTLAILMWRDKTIPLHQRKFELYCAPITTIIFMFLVAKQASGLLKEKCRQLSAKKDRP